MNTNMKKIYVKPLMKDHKLMQTNALLVVNSQGEEIPKEELIEDDVDGGW